jgi:hypothetical protein
MTLQNKQEEKLVIQVKHPVQELRELSSALKTLCRSGLSKEEIQQQKLRIKEANVYHQLIRAYVRYLQFRITYLEQRIAELERS